MIYWLVNNERSVHSVNRKAKDGFYKGSSDEVDEKQYSHTPYNEHIVSPNSLFGICSVWKTQLWYRHRNVAA